MREIFDNVDVESTRNILVPSDSFRRYRTAVSSKIPTNSNIGSNEFQKIRVDVSILFIKSLHVETICRYKTIEKYSLQTTVYLVASMAWKSSCRILANYYVQLSLANSHRDNRLS